MMAGTLAVAMHASQRSLGSRSRSSWFEAEESSWIGVTVTDHYRFGRDVAHVPRGETDAGGVVIRTGMARVFRCYATAFSPLLT